MANMAEGSGIEGEDERVFVFYLVVEHGLEGFGWRICQFGLETARARSRHLLATELEARSEGQAALISISAFFDYRCDAEDPNNGQRWAACRDGS